MFNTYKDTTSTIKNQQNIINIDDSARRYWESDRKPKTDDGMVYSIYCQNFNDMKNPAEALKRSDSDLCYKLMSDEFISFKKNGKWGTCRETYCTHSVGVNGYGNLMNRFKRHKTRLVAKDFLNNMVGILMKLLLL